VTEFKDNTEKPGEMKILLRIRESVTASQCLQKIRTFLLIKEKINYLIIDDAKDLNDYFFY